jgi:branched-chain amino acid transport system ATP-binding protein/branched-chain amino acid transport system permease protein
MSRVSRSRTWFTVAAVTSAVLFPVFATSSSLRADATHAAALLLGATALNLALGYAGQPSLGHGALMGAGAYSYALLRADANLGPVVAVLGAVAAAAICGALVSRAVARLRAPFVALTTWMLAWMFWVALSSFPGRTGGASGTVVPQTRLDLHLLGIKVSVGAVLLYEIAVVAVALATLASLTGLRRFGPALAAQREEPLAASAAGVDVVRLRMVAFIVSAGLAGLAGVIEAQASGVADPSTFRPLLSAELFLVVLVGGAGELLGPVAGLASLLVVASVAGALGDALGVTGERVEPLAVALLLAVVLLVGRRGLVPLVRDRLRQPPPAVPEVPPRAAAWRPGARIAARGISVSFDGLQALDNVTFEAGPGGCHALIGPNGSGKTTLLRVLAGGLRPDGGTVLLDERELAGDAPHERARAGVVRTLQQVALAPGMTGLDHVISGLEPVRRTGLVQAVTSTPLARAEERAVASEAQATLAELGALSAAQRRAGDLAFADRRLVQLARALVARPSVLLLDEPSAGLDEHATQRVLRSVEHAKANGTTIVLVAHDLALVRALADRVTVLDAGVVIADGTADEVSSDPRVVAAYLGP